MDDNEVIAVLVAGYDEDGAERATVILRDLHGNVSMKQMDIDEAPLHGAAGEACFRRGKPIRDPVSREVVGYELERVALPH
jgi:hypothetical protein